MNNQNMNVLINTIGAVESGGQIYGNRRYEAYAAPYTNSPNEHTITLGWAQNYGNNARELVKRILDADKTLAANTSKSIKNTLSQDWVAIRFNPTSSQKAEIISMISSGTGKKVQDKMFAEDMEKFISDCKRDYPSADVKAQMMYCEIRHLGGKGPTDRIFGRLNGDYSLDSIMASLAKDQRDTSNNNQVGDAIYWSRHVKCRQFIDRYATTESSSDKEVKKMTKTEQATQQMEAWAIDNSHGYDQVYRWGERGDYDCSAAVIQAWENAGVPVKKGGATYTGNMYGVFINAGFMDVTAEVNKATGAGLLRGDVLLNTSHHVAMYCGNGKEVEASINEFGGVTGGQPGDQTGTEFLIRSYRDYPWTHILRYKDSEQSTVLKHGDTGSAVEDMQKMLIAVGYDCGDSGADGRFGDDTDAALRRFQKDYKLKVDGLYGDESRAALENAYLRRNWNPTGTAICTDDDVNVRATPGGTILGQLFTGQRFEVDGQKQDGWVRCYVAGIGLGWIYGDYVKYDNQDPTPKPSEDWKPIGTAICTDDDVNLRSTASDKNDKNILGILNTGQRFEVNGKKSNGWVRANVAGVGLCWIYGAYVKYD